MKKNAFVIVLSALIMFSANGIAQDHGRGHDRDKHEDHPGRGHIKRERVVVRHDDDYREVIVKDRHVFYHGGAFYERRPEGYVVVNAPIGARIDVLPVGYRVVHYRRARYFLFGGIYYRFLPRERVYVVVTAPF